MKKFTKVYQDRLLLLADFLTTMDRERFNFSVFFDNAGTSQSQSDNPLYHECGSTGCALGWATAIPEFRELGLYMYEGTPKLPSGRRSFSAAEELFGLTCDESWFLFDAEMRLNGAHWISPEYEASATEVA